MGKVKHVRRRHRADSHPATDATAAATAAATASCVEALEFRRLFSAGSPNFDPVPVAVDGFQFDYHNGVTTQADGKILIAGYVGTSGVGSGTDLAVARYTSAGAIDFAFGTGGVATIALPGDQEGKSIAIDGSGRAVVAGTTRNAGVFSFAVARFTAGGAADGTFDGDGVATASFGVGQNSLAYAVKVQNDGNIVTAGKNFNGSNYDFALARFTPTGALDNTFDGDGLHTANPVPGSDAELTGMALQTDQKIVVTGTVTGPGMDPSQFVIARFGTGGTEDAGFDGDGFVFADFGAGNVAGGVGVTVQADGKIVASGSVTNASNGESHFALARYTTTGLVDNSFDGDGKVTIAFGSTDRGEVVAMQSVGGQQRIVVAGSTGSHGSFALARLNLDGSLDITFDGDGKVVTPVTEPGTDGVERVTAIAMEVFPSPSHLTNIVTIGVDTSNQLILASHSGGDVIFVDDEWTVTNDVAPPGLSNGDTVTDLTTGISATYGVDAFSTIPDGINAASAGGLIYVLGGADKTYPAAGPFVLNDNKTIDLTDNSLIVHGGNVGMWTGLFYDGLTGQIASGRHGGAWDGIGIITSAPTAQGGGAAPNTLGIATAQQVKGLSNPGDTAIWRGLTVTGTDALIMFTYSGDLNLDGQINISDYGLIDFNIGIGSKGYYNGDMNYDGTINISDYGIIDFNVGIQGPPLFAGSSLMRSSATSGSAVVLQPPKDKDGAADEESERLIDLLA